jgi:hypothetical protein
MKDYLEGRNVYSTASVDAYKKYVQFKKKQMDGERRNG